MNQCEILASSHTFPQLVSEFEGQPVCGTFAIARTGDVESFVISFFSISDERWTHTDSVTAAVRWMRQVNVKPATYRFYAQADGGIRVWIDDNCVIDRWQDGVLIRRACKNRADA